MIQYFIESYDYSTLFRDVKNQNKTYFIQGYNDRT